MNDNDIEADATAELAEEFLTWWRRQHRRKNGTAPAAQTEKNKRSAISAIQRYIHAVSVQHPLDFTDLFGNRDTFEDLKDAWERSLSVGTVNNYLATVMQLQEFLVAQGMVDHGVVNKADFLAAAPPPPITIYTDHEIERILLTSWGGGYRWACLLHLLADTGRRVGELLSIEWDWLHEDRGGHFFALPKTKNGDQQYIPVSAEFSAKFLTGVGLEELRCNELWSDHNYRRPTDIYLFPWGYNSARDRFVRQCKRAGVTYRGFHNFRHTVITNRLAAGVPLQAVAALAGHRDPTMTATRYNHATALSYRNYLNREGRSRPREEGPREDS